MSATTAAAWAKVSRRQPCPICEKPDWCLLSSDGETAYCMRRAEGCFKVGHDAQGQEYYLHDLTGRRDRFAPAPPRFAPPPPAEPTFDIPTARATYHVTAAICADLLTDTARAEFVRRFGPECGPRAAEVFGLGYCPADHTLPRALADCGRQGAAIASGILWDADQPTRSLAGRLVIPYRRGGATWDLRGAGLKVSGAKTAEMSLAGAYAERGVAELYFNHDALDTLTPGEDIHLAGGAFKTMALHLADLRAIGTRGEGEIGDAQLAALREAQPGRIILHIDAEEAKEGEELSAGRRLGLAKAERLRTIAPVFVAEPPREPGGAKVDPDALLRDYGPALLRAIALSAIPLDAWRLAIGVDAVGVPAAVAAENDELRRKYARAQTTLSHVIAVRRNTHIKAERDTLTAITLDLMAEVAKGNCDAEGWVKQPASRLAVTVGKGKQTIGKHRACAVDWGIIETKLVEEVDAQTGQRRTPMYVRAKHAPHEPERIFDVLVSLVPSRPDKAEWGGKREACPICGSNNTHREIRIICDDCGHVSKPLGDDGPIPTQQLGHSVPNTPREEVVPPPPPADDPTAAETLAGEATRALAHMRAQLAAVEPTGIYELHTSLGMLTGILTTPVPSILPRWTVVRTANGDEHRLPTADLAATGEVTLGYRRFATGARLVALLREAITGRERGDIPPQVVVVPPPVTPPYAGEAFTYQRGPIKVDDDASEDNDDPWDEMECNWEGCRTRLKRGAKYCDHHLNAKRVPRHEQGRRSRGSPSGPGTGPPR